MPVTDDLKQAGNSEKSKNLSRFFKTGKGQYGEGDIFLGVSVPEQRKIARRYYDISLNEIVELIESPIHECRLTGLLILVDQFQKANNADRKKVFDFYCKHSKKVNNWDLVDLSADKIVGEYLLDKDTSVLAKLANSDNLWERRISIVSTYAFIKQGRCDETIKIATILLHDKHDLIHKAVGWMLREAGKRDETVLIKFLNEHARHMPRTMLRYAIEKLDEKRRKRYLAR